MDTMTKRETLTAGDILHCGWGSDMSINDYYEVTRVTPSGKTAYIRPLRKTYAGNPNDMGGLAAAFQLPHAQSRAVSSSPSMVSLPVPQASSHGASSSSECAWSVSS